MGSYGLSVQKAHPYASPCEPPARPSRRAQANPPIGRVDDPLEREADRVADQMTTRRLATSSAAGPVDGQLDPVVRDFFESRLGHDFSRVRVHADSEAAASAASVHAKAYTIGSDLIFGAGRYQPGTPEGQRLLGHELTHVVQQARGVTRGVIQRDGLPVAKFSPSPGLYVDRTEKSVSITGAMELSGEEANADRAASIQNSINSTWTRTFPDGYAVSCSITVTYRGSGSPAGNATQIEAKKIAGPSHVSPGLGGRSMTLNASEADAFTWTPAHEFGHIIGLQDRYSEGIMSKIKGTFGGTRSTTVDPGYSGNIMAESGAPLESKNVRDVAAENEPSPYWVNDDDQVRDWVNGHSLSDIGKLSVASKLQAIKTLMGGWISDDDVAAIGRICASVTTHAQAEAVRHGVDLTDMTSIGQRTVVRLAFAKMP